MPFLMVLLHLYGKLVQVQRPNPPRAA